MKLRDIITEGPLIALSRQAAINNKMFGPVYHGTPNDIDAILAQGFSVDKSIPTGVYRDRPTGSTNGMPLTAYAWGIAAPVHFLGFGVYFTTVKAIAKRFNGDTTRGLKEFYVDTQSIIEINFGSPNTIMKWWVDNGYDMTVEETRNHDVKAWIRATRNLTETLKGKCSAVWYKGKGIRKLLDGDQIAVFDPEIIRIIDKKLSTGTEVGAKVVYDHTQTSPLLAGRNDVYITDIKDDDRYKGWQGVFRAIDHDGKDIPTGTGHPLLYIPPPGMTGIVMKKYPVPERFHAERGPYYIEVKWQRGGTKLNYSEAELKAAG